MRDADIELELVLFLDEVLDDEGSEEVDDWEPEPEPVWVRGAAAGAREGDMRDTFRVSFSHVG